MFAQSNAERPTTEFRWREFCIAMALAAMIAIALWTISSAQRAFYRTPHERAMASVNGRDGWAREEDDGFVVAHLNGGGIPIRDQSLQDLVAGQRLKKITAYQTLVSDEGLKHLHGHKDLRTLHLDGCVNVTDKSIPELSRLQQLRELSLTGTSISMAGLQALRESLPNCSILCTFASLLNTTLLTADEPSIERLDVGTEWEEFTNQVPKRDRPLWSFRIFRNPKNHDLLTVACSKVPHKRSFDDTMEFAPGGYPFWVPEDKEYIVNRVKTERTELFRFAGLPVDTIEYAFVNEIRGEDPEKTIMDQGFSLVLRENAYYVQHTSTRAISHWTAQLIVDKLLADGNAKGEKSDSAVNKK